MIWKTSCNFQFFKALLKTNYGSFRLKQAQLCFFWCKYELTLTVTDIIIEHFYIWLFLKTLGMRWWGWWLDDDESLMYNFTSPKQFNVLTAMSQNIHLSVSVSYSTYRRLQWKKVQWETAWRWQPTWEPCQAPLCEGDRGLAVCHLGSTLEPCIASCCTLLPVDPVLMPSPSVNLLHPSPCRSHIHAHWHSYHLPIQQSILSLVLNIYGWMLMVEMGRWTRYGEEDNVVGDCRQGAFAGTWGDPLHTHPQRLALLLLLSCSVHDMG